MPEVRCERRHAPLQLDTQCRGRVPDRKSLFLGRRCQFRRRPIQHPRFAGGFDSRRMTGKDRALLPWCSAASPVLHDVAFDHVTAFVTGPLFYVGDKTDEKIRNFSVTNSLFMNGGRRLEFSSSGGGQANCARGSQRAGAQAVLEACFINYKFEKNLIIGEKGGWPKGTILVSSPESGGHTRSARWREQRRTALPRRHSRLQGLAWRGRSDGRQGYRGRYGCARGSARWSRIAYAK